MKSLKIGNLTATVPIVQGGMGVGISLSGLASAVASEGGIGVISSAGLGAIYSHLSKDYRQASILMENYLKNYPDDAQAKREYEFLSTR